jgi:hypothetical protein
MPSDLEVADWLNHPEAHNIAIRLPAGVIGFDVDAYMLKVGGQTIAGFETDLGPLPPTYRSTSRDDETSGIFFYTVPEDLGHVADLGPNVEIVQRTYRYAVVWPSVHPDDVPYHWYGPSGAPCLPPALQDLPALPQAWVAWLVARRDAQRARQEAVVNRSATPLTETALATAATFAQDYLHAKLGKMYELPTKGTSALWDTTVYGVARDLVKLTNSWWCPVTHEEARLKYEEACVLLEDGTSWDDALVEKWVRATAEMTDELPLPAEVQRAMTNRLPLDASNEAEYEDSLIDLIGKGPLSNIFKRGTGLISFRNIGESGYTVPAEDDSPSAPTYSSLDVNDVVALVDGTYWVFEWQGPKNNREKVHVLSPKEATQRAMSRATEKEIQEARIITRTPLVLPTGALLDAPGYDDAYKVVYLPMYHNETAPVHWTSSAAAREYLISEKSTDGLFGQFPWSGLNSGNDSRATYLALLLTPLLELMCPSPWPLFAITAPDRGSGKSLATQCASVLYGGSVRGMSRDSEEFRKAVSTALTATSGKIITFDNVEKVVANDEMSRLLTEPVWTDRLLGKNVNISVPNDRLWALTGNNIQIGQDQRRRTMWIQIDAQCEKPWERTDFRDKNLKSTMAQEWETIISALCFMITDWMKAGSPLADNAPDRNDEYGLWSRTINGVLAYSKAEGRVGRTERAAGLIESDAWGALYAAIAEEYRDGKWTVSKIFRDVSLQGAVEGAIGTPVSVGRLGKALAKHMDQWVDGMRIVNAGKLHNAVQWKLEATAGFPDEATAPPKSDASLGINFNYLLGDST